MHEHKPPNQDYPEDDHQNEDFDGDHRVSKSQLKRESHARQSLGEELVQLNRDQLRKFELPEDLLQAIQMAQTIKQRAAKKRQLQYIGKLMRTIDVDPIKQVLDDLKGVSAQAIATQHKIEQWRQRLIDEGDDALQALLQQYPAIDRQRIRQLLRSAQKEAQANKPPKAFRELFKYLREFLQ
ncbi:ribosome biogenesis factor YjgA [Kaarinaea lacus]